MAGDGDEGFGDFKFAPPNRTVNSNPTIINGHDYSSPADNDADDWGDFINPGGLSHTISLPRFPKHLDPIGLSTDQKVKNEDSEPSQPGSAPARVLSGMAQWKKPTGGLPLSIFGELEEEGQSGARDPSFGDGGAILFSSKNADSVEKESGAKVNDLIFNLYKLSDSRIESGQDLNRSSSVEKMNKNEKNSDVNINVLSLGAIEYNSNSHGLDFSWNRVNSSVYGKVKQTLNSPGFNLDWDPLNLNPNGLNSNRDVIEGVKSSANGVNLSFNNGNDDGGWEFKDAQPRTPRDEEISETIQIKTENGPVSNLNGFNSSWNSLSFDLNDWNSNSNRLNSNEDVTKNGKSDNGGDDEGEFKDVQPKAPMGEEISKTSQIKIENRPVSNLNGLNSTWNSLNFNLNGWNSNSNGTDSNKDGTKEVKLIAEEDKLGFIDDNERIDNGDDDEWEFKDAQHKTPVVEEISKSQTNQMKIENGPVANLNGFYSTWNSLSLDLNGWNSNSNGLNSNKYVMEEVKSIAKGDKLGSTDGNEWEFNNGNDDEWEFKDAQPKTPLVEEISKTSQIKTENEPVSNLIGLNSTWNSLSFDLSGWDSNLNNVSSSTNCLSMGLVHQSREHADTAAAAAAADDRWEFKIADKKDGENTFGFGNDVHGPGHLFGPSQRTSPKLGESNSEFDISSNKIKQNNNENKFSFSPVDEKLGAVENSWVFKDAFLEAGLEKKEETKLAEVSSAVETLVFDGEVQGNKVEMDNHKRALPLSFFGDEEEEADDAVIHQDDSTQMPTSDPRNAIKKSQVDINDLISSLYSQAVRNTSVNYEQTLIESGLDSTSTGIGFDFASDNHDFDDSWEFQNASASLGTRDENFFDLGESRTKYSIKTELNDYVELFSKFREELRNIALNHLENLKKAPSAASLTDSDAKIQSIDKEIQDLKSEMQDIIISSEFCSENRSPGKRCLNVFVEVLQEPEFQVFASEYQLSEKLSLVCLLYLNLLSEKYLSLDLLILSHYFLVSVMQKAESDWRSTIELLKYVALIVNILTSVSREEQSSYISAWSKMLSVCAQEMRHGAFIWKQAQQDNIQNQILSKPQGKKYVLALGEIYRVAEVLGSSAKLYKPWILANSTDSMYIFTLMSECSSLWSSSGLEEALQSILSVADFEYDGSLKTLLESMKYINDLDVFALYNRVFSRQSHTCQLSALTAGLVPGMKTVAWNGKHCFLTLANLWANLISSDPPNLPCIHVG